MDIRHAVGVKAGVPAEQLADVLTYQQSPHFSERERAALEFCERVTRDDLEMSDACLERLREHFTEPEVVDRGQQEVLNWWCLMGAMEELGNKEPAYHGYVESYVMNSNKCFAAYPPR